MKAWLVKSWSTNDYYYGSPLESGQLIAQGDKYYFRRDSDSKNASMNPPDGKITWVANVGPYELCVITPKGLLYSPRYDGPAVDYLVPVVTL